MEDGRLKGWRVSRAWGIAGVLCLMSGLAPAPASAAPKIHVPTPRVELGELIAGDTAEVAFLLTNAGTEPLKIAKIETTCDCITSSYPETLKPGESGALQVKLVSNALWAG